MVDLLDEVDKLATRATALRNRQAYRPALEELDRAIQKMTDELGRLAPGDAILEALNAQRASSETLSLIGRIYKDLWSEMQDQNETRALGFLRKAIDAYERGFLADPRDAPRSCGFAGSLRRSARTPGRCPRQRPGIICLEDDRQEPRTDCEQPGEARQGHESTPQYHPATPPSSSPLRV